MAQRQLVKQLLENRDAILGFLFALTRDYDLAEEVFQDVSMVILEEDRRETVVVNFMAWTREVARRRVAEQRRETARREAIEHPSDSLTDIVSQAFAENEPLQEGHRLQALLKCVERLTGRAREVIDGFYGRRLSLRDLAVALKWQENSVKVALSRARKALADCVNHQLRNSEAT